MEVASCKEVFYFVCFVIVCIFLFYHKLAWMALANLKKVSLKNKKKRKKIYLMENIAALEALEDSSWEL